MLNNKFRLGIILAVGLYASIGFTKTADIIYLGDNIVTVNENNSDANAVAIQGELIIAVGDKADVLKLQGENTTIVELGNKALLPGLIDAHGHLSFQAYLTTQVNLSSAPVGNVESIDDLKATLSDFIQRNEIPKGQWVMGFGYDESLLKDQRHPNRNDLDQVSTEHPIYLTHVSGHLGAVNSNALELAGINAETPNPKGGAYRRLPNSDKPNGVLEEKAAFGFRALFPQPSLEQSLKNVVAAQHYYAKHGITTIQDGAASSEVIQLLQYVASQKQFFIDTVAYQFILQPEEKLPTTVSANYSNQFRIGGVKLVLDGSPQGKTAYLSKPYAVPPHGQDSHYRGYPIHEASIANGMVDRVLSANLPLIAHANGDAAAEILVSAVEKSSKKLTNKDTRVTMIHAQTVRDDQLDRMAVLGMIPSFFQLIPIFGATGIETRCLE